MSTASVTVSYQRAQGSFLITKAKPGVGKMVDTETRRVSEGVLRALVNDQDVSETIERAMQNPYQEFQVSRLAPRTRY